MITGPLHVVHISEAKELKEYHQWEMPVSYTSVQSEFEAASSGVALVDHSCFGRILVTGDDRLDLLHRLSTNDLLSATPTQVLGTVFATDKGRVVDVATVLVLEKSLLLVVSPNNEGNVMRWIEKYTISEDVKLTSLVASKFMVSLIGPRAINVIRSVFSLSLRENSCTEIPLANTQLLVASVETARGQLIHIIGDNSVAPIVWEQIAAGAKHHGLVKMGSLGYEAFRISRGIASMGGEISEMFNPYEVGLRELINFTKGCYIGQEVIARLDTYQKVKRRLVGLILASPPSTGAMPRRLVKDAAEVGMLTSYLATPIHGKFMGLAVVRTDLVVEGDFVIIQDREHDIRAVVISTPILP